MNLEARDQRGYFEALVGDGRPLLTLTGFLLVFGAAIGVHPTVGYVAFFHLAPAYIGALIFLTGIVLSLKSHF